MFWALVKLKLLKNRSCNFPQFSWRIGRYGGPSQRNLPQVLSKACLKDVRRLSMLMENGRLTDRVAEMRRGPSTLVKKGTCLQLTDNAQCRYALTWQTIVTPSYQKVDRNLVLYIHTWMKIFDLENIWVFVSKKHFQKSARCGTILHKACLSAKISTCGHFTLNCYNFPLTKLSLLLQH